MKKLLYIIPLFFLLSCASKQFIEVPVEVPVETVRTEYIHDIKHDSIFVKDSVDRWMKGDTMFIYKEHIKYRFLNKTDTICKVDSIPKVIKISTPVPYEKKVEVNRLYWWQKLFIWAGVASVIALVGFLVYKLKLKK